MHLDAFSLSLFSTPASFVYCLCIIISLSGVYLFVSLLPYIMSMFLSVCLCIFVDMLDVDGCILEKLCICFNDFEVEYGVGS